MTCVLLHSSGYSSVFLGAATGDSSAALSCFKVYNKDYPLQPRHWLNISRECGILSRLQEDRVDGIVRLLSVADTAKQFSLQFKPCLGGNLYQCLERRECCGEQELCTKVVIPLLRVLDSLHSRGIIHRDIKPENIFFEEDGKLVLGDFGLAIDCSKDRPCSRVGTQDYMAPEVLSQPSADTVALRKIPAHMLTPYTTAVDIWAVGTLIHEALTGKVPFYHHDPSVMALKAQFSPAARLPSSVSTECQAFVDAVLQKQQGKRPTAAELLQHPWVQTHAAAASSLVAARLKAKFLAELRLPAGNTTSSAKTSPVAPPMVSHDCRSAASLHVARSLRNSPAAPTTAHGLSSSCCTASPAAARVNLDSSISSKASTSSSYSGNDGLMDRADSSCTVSSCSSKSGHSGSSTAARSAGAQEHCHNQQQQVWPEPSAGRPCGCKSHGVSFDCGALSEGQVHQPPDTSPRAAALKAAAAAAAGASQQVRLPQPPPQQQHRATAPGMSLGSQDCSRGGMCCSAAAAADAGSTPHSDVLPQQLQLVPALSEPMLVDVHTLPEHPASKSQGDNSSGACCCCTGGQRSSQSGTCSTAAAAADTHPLVCAHSAPANTGELQELLAAGHQPRALGTLAARAGARRAVQLGRATSTAAATPASRQSSGTARSVTAAAVARAAGPQKPPLLKSSSIAAPPAQAAAAAASPRAMLSSPPKPALLLQRLRSLALKGHSSAGGSPAWNRRHSVDLAAASPGAGAAEPSTPSGTSDPAVGTEPPAAAAAAAAALPDLVSPPRAKARPPAAAGMTSPLAALCRLGGLLSPASATAAAAAATAAKRPNSCCTAPCGGRTCDLGSVRAQRNVMGAGAGAAGLLVGLAGCEPGAVLQGAAYVRHAEPYGVTTPPQACRSAKGVCMKMLNHVLKHHQHA